MKTAFTPTRVPTRLLCSGRPGALHPVAGGGVAAGKGGGHTNTSTATQVGNRTDNYYGTDRYGKKTLPPGMLMHMHMHTYMH